MANHMKRNGEAAQEDIKRTEHIWSDNKKKEDEDEGKKGDREEQLHIHHRLQGKTTSLLELIAS